MVTNLLLRSLKRFYPHAIGKKFNFNLKNVSSHTNSIKISRLCSTISYQGRDPAPLFLDETVQKVLKKLTGLNIEKIYNNRYLENPDSVEEYKFLTKEELQERVDESLQEAQRLLQMPPVLKEREPIEEILSFDPAIQGDETSNIVITDISFGVSDRDRIILVREPNGVLRKAFWEERERMNYIYNPRPGKWYKTPPVFEGKYLEEALDRGECLFVLDYACAHFEPDDPKYQQVTITVYEHINKKSQFEVLHSTRHYGPMCFYYAWAKKIDSLLLYYIHKERFEEAVDLVTLYYMINDSTKAIPLEGSVSQLEYIKKYVAGEGKMTSNLELAIQTYEDAQREREKLEKTIKESHGIS